MSNTSVDRWDRRFLELSRFIAQWSKDPSTKVGAVVVGEDREIRSTGFNGLPRGLVDSINRLYDRELKYKLVTHAEENSILHAARIGVSLKGCTIYCTWPPCMRCAGSIIQAGIATVVFPESDIPERWKEEFLLGCAILREGGVAVRIVSEVTDG